MTTSLPTTPTDTAAATTGATPALSADLAALFAANPTLYAGGPAAAAQNFGAMLNADNGNFAASTASTVTAPAAKSCAPTRATDARVLANVATDETDAGTALPDRTTLEAALALVLPLVMSPTPPPTEIGVAGVSARTETAIAGDFSAGVGEGADANSAAVPAPRVTLALPGQPAMELALDAQAAPADIAENFAALAQDAAATTDALAATPTVSDEAAAPKPTAAAPTPASTVAAAPLRAELPAVTTTAPAQTASAFSAADGAESDSVALTASVELPDGSVVQVTSSNSSAPTPSAASSVTQRAEAEKTAALSERESGAFSEEKSEGGKNFLSTADEGLSSIPKKGGIAVAQERSPMFLPPHDALPAVSPTVSAHVAFVAAPAAAEPAPMPELTAATLAHRAVETVTNVVEAQEASKLQPVPSVQLKFRVGSDDLAVRVELRDGVVRTEFRTNSSELRAAIDQEWKAVTAQPTTALRYLEPVFSPGGSSSSSNNAFAQGNPQHSAAQQQQQQQQQQAHQQARAAAELFGSVGRATPYQPREGGAAAPAVVPLVTSTSHHLSAVA